MDTSFADPWKLTPEEVRAWAYGGDLMPDQDWELALTGTRLHRLCVELASDDDCPTRGFFLGILYMTVGQAVRSNFSTVPRVAIEELISAASHSDCPSPHGVNGRASSSPTPAPSTTPRGATAASLGKPP